MSQNEFCDGPARSGILNSTEIIDIFRHYNSTIEKPSLPFPCEKRNSPMFRCLRASSIEDVTMSLSFENPSVQAGYQFSVDTTISLCGVGIFGRNDGKKTLEVRVYLDCVIIPSDNDSDTYLVECDGGKK